MISVENDDKNILPYLERRSPISNAEMLKYLGRIEEVSFSQRVVKMQARTKLEAK